MIATNFRGYKTVWAWKTFQICSAICQLVSTTFANCVQNSHTHTHTALTHTESKWMKNEFNCPMLSVNIFEMGSHMDQRKDKGTRRDCQNKKRAREQHFGNIFMTATAVKLWPLSAQFTCLGGGVGVSAGRPSLTHIRAQIMHTHVCELWEPPPPPVLWIELLLHSNDSHCLSVGIKANFAHFGCLTRLAVSRQISFLSFGACLFGSEAGLRYSAFSSQQSAFSHQSCSSVLACCLWQQQQQQQPQRAT